MSLWDFLTNIGNNISNKGSQLFQNMTNSNQSGGAAPLMAGLQLDMNGDIQQVNTPPENFDVGNKLGDRIKHGVKNFNLSDALLGKSAAPTDYTQNTTDENGMLNAGISENPRRGGLINDITAGARENFNNSFRGENWLDNQTSDGRQKGFAYRLGEGLGSLGRFMESPAGRSLLTAGLVGATGGSGLEALAYGGQAGLINQNARSADTLYRNQLKNNYGMTDEELNNIRGYVNRNDFNTLASNIYKNNALNVRQAIADAKDKRTAQNLIFRAHNNGQLSDSEAQLQLQAVDFKFSDTKDGKPQLKTSNSTKNADINAELLPYKKYALQTAPQIAMGNLAVAQGRLGLMGDEFAYKVAKDEYDRTHPKAATDLANSLNSIKNQLDRFSNTFDNVDNPYRYRVAGGVSNFLNTLSEDESNFNSQASLLLNKIARDLGGEKGVLSDQDIQRIKESMPTLKDTKKQKKAKMKAIYALLDDRMNYATGGRTISNQPVKVGKYTVRVK